MYELVHQTIFEAVSNLIGGGDGLTPDLLKKQLPINTDLGGLMTLGQYLDLLEVEATSLTKAYEDGRTIYDLSLRRELIRLGEDRRPRLDIFNDKGAIEQDADVVIFLHREEFYLLNEEPPFGSYEREAWMQQMDLTHGLAELIIGKQRNGATGTVNLFFDPTIGSFGDLHSG
jgi:replicative DNA helicase